MTNNPVLIALAHLLRSIYGDSLAYRDGGYQHRYRDRVEAACALVEAGAVVLRPVTVMQGGRPYKRHMMAVVASQSRGKKHVHHVHIPEGGMLYSGDDIATCDCEDYTASARKLAPFCIHIGAGLLAYAFQACLDAIPDDPLPINAEQLAAALA